MKVGTLLLFCAVWCLVAGQLRRYYQQDTRRCGDVLVNYLDDLCGAGGFNGPNEVKKSSSTLIPTIFRTSSSIIFCRWRSKQAR